MSAVKGFLMAGIGGTLSYYIVNFIVGTLITGTDTAATFFKAIVPLAVAAGCVWLVISYAFKGDSATG